MENILDQLTDLEDESIKRCIPIIGRDKGAWLLQKVQELKPEDILELGTANGYSGCILGSEGAELLTIEINETIAEEAMKNLSTFEINAQIIMGDGVDVVHEFAKKNTEIFDLIFIDFHKKGYFKVLNSCIKLVKKGGYIIADNITFDDCQDFKQAVLSHPQLETEIIDIKDGLSCSKKVS